MLDLEFAQNGKYLIYLFVIARLLFDRLKKLLKGYAEGFVS